MSHPVSSKVVFGLGLASLLILILSACQTDSPVEQSRSSLQGLDVSHFNHQIEWGEVAKADIAFAFAKATEGVDYTDPMFSQNWDGMTQAQILKGAYHFYVVEDDPSDQAQNFISQVQLQSGDLPPVVDIESGSGVSSDTLSKNLKIWLDLIETHYGMKPIIYTSTNFWNAHLVGDFSDYPLWIAQYDVEEPILPNGFESWVFWQYEENGQVAGVSTKVDKDIFQGDLTALKQWTLKP